MDDIQTQINQINEAISAIEGGAQSYSINNRKIERAKISDLYAERRALISQLNTDLNGGFGIKTSIARFDRR